MASYCVLDAPDYKTDAYTHRGDKRPFKVKGDIINDSKLCVKIRDELENADIVVGWNSILHDIPLLNARLALAGERPCHLDEKSGTRHIDLMYYVGGLSMKIGGRRLDTAAKFFDLETQKTPLDGTTWQRAATGDKKSMDLIQKHCEHDTMALRDAWPYCAPLIKKMTFSLSEVHPFITQIPSRRNGKK
jgi:uncharacterized protein YprB with RNaseH-like and TPR domain